MEGSIVRLMKWDTRSVDHSSYAPRNPEFVFNVPLNFNLVLHYGSKIAKL